jgi:hypothetical protein
MYEQSDGSYKWSSYSGGDYHVYPSVTSKKKTAGNVHKGFEIGDRVEFDDFIGASKEVVEWTGEFRTNSTLRMGTVVAKTYDRPAYPGPYSHYFYTVQWDNGQITDKLISYENNPWHNSSKTATDELWSARATQRILNCPGCGNDDQNFFKFMYSDGSFNTFQCSDCMTEFMSDVHGTQTPIEMVTSLPFKKRNLEFEQLGYDGQMQASKSAANTNWDRKEGYMLGSDQFGRVWYSGGRDPMTQEFTFTEVEGEPTIFATDIYAAEAKLRKRLHIDDSEAIYNNKPFGWGKVTTSGKTANWGEDSLGKKMMPGEKMYTFIIDEDEYGGGEEIDIYARNDIDAGNLAKQAADEIMGLGQWNDISPIEPGGSGGQVYTFGSKKVAAGQRYEPHQFAECSICRMPAEVVAHMQNGAQFLLCRRCDRANRPDDFMAPKYFSASAMGDDFNEDEYERMIALDPNNKDFGVDPAFLEELEEKHKPFESEFATPPTYMHPDSNAFITWD